MWRFKYLLIGMLISSALGVVVFFVGRFAFTEIQDEFQRDAVIAVQDGFRVNDPGPITETRIVITERQLTDALLRADASSSAFSQDGLKVDLVPDEIRIVDGNADGGATTFVVVRPTIVNGRVDLGEPDGFLGIVLPMGTIANEIETQSANIFNENNVTPTSIEVTEGELIIQVVPKPGATLATPRASPRSGTGTVRRPTVTPGATASAAGATEPDATSAPRSARTPATEPTPTRATLGARPTSTATPES